MKYALLKVGKNNPHVLVLGIDTKADISDMVRDLVSGEEIFFYDEAKSRQKNMKGRLCFEYVQNTGNTLQRDCIEFEINEKEGIVVIGGVGLDDYYSFEPVSRERAEQEIANQLRNRELAGWRPGYSNLSYDVNK